MKKIRETTSFSLSGDQVWEVISNVSRCDWLPTVNHVDLDGDIRSFEMEGMGKIKERIIELNHETKTLVYSAIETRTPIEHHLATMKVVSIDDNACELEWSTEIEPEIFADAIKQGMQISINGLKSVLASK